ncbi:MAG: (d)CMP kinase [Flavobacteriaceae bacterium]|nr:(d)CMP kinase [Flavobacteriaceae bacterium]MDG1961987.1 (d)CMP kinase [Flavobacteriaceae bacterium]
MKTITIAIDGHSSTGKSTVARALAQHLGYVYIDSGAMYRTITLYALEHDMFENGLVKPNLLIEALPGIEVAFEKNELGQNVPHLNGRNCTIEIRQMLISELVSQVAAIPEVREKMVAMQRSFQTQGGVVMDGRDIGSVVFPNADLKLFMTATAEVRAQRRFIEIQESDPSVTYQQVYDNVVARDAMDSSRAVSPLIVADGAVVIDNSEMNQADQFQMILQLAQDRIYNRI